MVGMHQDSMAVRCLHTNEGTEALGNTAPLRPNKADCNEVHDVFSHGPGAEAGQAPAMLTVHQVAHMLNCSVRHVYRLCDAGRMPRPVRLGALVRWNRTAIESWIEAGCPAPKGGRR